MDIHKNTLNFFTVVTENLPNKPFILKHNTTFYKGQKKVSCLTDTSNRSYSLSSLTINKNKYGLVFVDTSLQNRATQKFIIEDEEDGIEI